MGHLHFGWINNSLWIYISYNFSVHQICLSCSLGERRNYSNINLMFSMSIYAMLDSKYDLRKYFERIKVLGKNLKR